MGVRTRPYPLDRAGTEPFAGPRGRSARWPRISGVPRRRSSSYAAKPVIYGTLAARLAGVPCRAAMITGIGSVLLGGRASRQRALFRLLRALYALALRSGRRGLLPEPGRRAPVPIPGALGADQRVVRINGSGVDLARTSPRRRSLPRRYVPVRRAAHPRQGDRGVRRGRSSGPGRAPGCPVPAPGTPRPQPHRRHGLARSSTGSAEGVVEYLGATADVRPFLARPTSACSPPTARALLARSSRPWRWGARSS